MEGDGRGLRGSLHWEAELLKPVLGNVYCVLIILRHPKESQLVMEIDNLLLIHVFSSHTITLVNGPDSHHHGRDTTFVCFRIFIAAVTLHNVHPPHFTT